MKFLPPDIFFSILYYSDFLLTGKTEWDSDYVPSVDDETFGPLDLLKLINVLGKEVTVCEGLLKDELDKRKRYKVSCHGNIDIKFSVYVHLACILATLWCFVVVLGAIQVQYSSAALFLSIYLFLMYNIHN